MSIRALSYWNEGPQLFRCLVEVGTILDSDLSQFVIMNIRMPKMKNSRGILDNAEQGLQVISAHFWKGTESWVFNLARFSGDYCKKPTSIYRFKFNRKMNDGANDEAICSLSRSWLWDRSWCIQFEDLFL